MASIFRKIDIFMYKMHFSQLLLHNGIIYALRTSKRYIIKGPDCPPVEAINEPLHNVAFWAYQMMFIAMNHPNNIPFVVLKAYLTPCWSKSWAKNTFYTRKYQFFWKWRPLEATNDHKWPWWVVIYIVHVLRGSKIYII